MSKRESARLGLMFSFRRLRIKVLKPSLGSLSVIDQFLALFAPISTDPDRSRGALECKQVQG